MLHFAQPVDGLRVEDEVVLGEDQVGCAGDLRAGAGQGCGDPLFLDEPGVAVCLFEEALDVVVDRYPDGGCPRVG